MFQLTELRRPEAARFQNSSKTGVKTAHVNEGSRPAWSYTCPSSSLRLTEHDVNRCKPIYMYKCTSTDWHNAFTFNGVYRFKASCTSPQVWVCSLNLSLRFTSKDVCEESRLTDRETHNCYLGQNKMFDLRIVMKRRLKLMESLFLSLVDYEIFSFAPKKLQKLFARRLFHKTKPSWESTASSIIF